MKKEVFLKIGFESVYYFVSGDFSLQELQGYVSRVENNAQVVIDPRNMLKDNMFRTFQTFYTPYVIITKNDSIIAHFGIDFQEDSLYQFLNKLQVSQNE